MRPSTQLMCCVLILFCWPAAALAAPPDGSGVEQCLTCHQAETSAWLTSPHAAVTAAYETAATCEQCHGIYEVGHPGTDLMALTLDSSICVQCHAATVDQWQHTRHASAGVECIGCHMAHSQEFRLTDDRRCSACHRDETQNVNQTAHGRAEVDCVDCHVNSRPSTTQNENLIFVSSQNRQAVQAPDHDFIHVSDSVCLDCHTEDAHNGLPATAGERVTEARLAAMANFVPDLTAKIDELQGSNWTLTILIPVALGVGLGVGGILGVVWMLACSAARDRRSS